METLSPDQYDRVIPLVHGSGMRGHLAFAYEVIEGVKKGTIFVDQIQRPRSALICNETGFFFAYGDPDEEITRPTIQQLWRQKDWRYATCLFGSTPGWGEIIQQVLGPLGAAPTARLGFELRTEPDPTPVPPGYTLQPIDAQLAQSILDGTGTGGYGIDPWFIRICGGAEGYSRHGLGLALVQDGQIASVCGFCALANGEAELEIGTVPAQREKGLAAIVSRAFMDQCQERGFMPVYTCTSTNLPSRAVAHKLGYVEVEEVTGFYLPTE